MIRRLYEFLPGPPALKRVQILVLAVLVAITAAFFYDWLGSTFFDSGGTLG